MRDVAYDRIAQQLATVDPAAIAAAVKRGDAPNALPRFLDGCWAGNPPSLAAQEAAFDLDDRWHRDAAAALIGIAPFARSTNRRRSQRLTGETARRAATKAFEGWETGVNPHDGSVQMRRYLGRRDGVGVRTPWLSIPAAAAIAARLETTGSIPADPEVLTQYGMTLDVAERFVAALVGTWERLGDLFVDTAGPSRRAQRDRADALQLAREIELGDGVARLAEVARAVRDRFPDLGVERATEIAQALLRGDEVCVTEPLPDGATRYYAVPEQIWRELAPHLSESVLQRTASR